MRVAVYADLRYRRDEAGVSSDTAFVTWLAGLADHLDELVVLGRTDPRPGRADHPLTGVGVRFVALPWYESLHRPLRVLGAAAGSLRCWEEELAGLDAALLFGPHPLALLLGWRAKRAGVPVLVGVRQDFPEYLRHRIRGRRRLLVLPVAHLLEVLHRRLARGGGVVAVGDAMGARYRVPRAALMVTGISLVRADDLVGEDEALARTWPGERRALSAGRLDPEKNPLLLVEVARLLREDGPWVLEVAGTGSLAARLAAAARPLDGAIVLRGRLPREELYRRYRSATVFVHVSHTEGQPQVLYEAAAAGVPIVATAVGGVAAALADGRRGLLVPPGDAAAVVACVLRLGAEPERREAIVRAALEWVRGETVEAQTARVAAFVGSVAARGRRPAASSPAERRG